MKPNELKEFCEKHKGEKIRMLVEIEPGEKATGEPTNADRGWLYQRDGWLDVGNAYDWISFYCKEISSLTVEKK